NANNTLVLDGVGHSLTIAGELNGGTVQTVNGATLRTSFNVRVATGFNGTFVDSDVTALSGLSFTNGATLAPGRKLHMTGPSTNNTLTLNPSFSGEIFLEVGVSPFTRISSGTGQSLSS